jgi:hypothetical protein
MATGGVLHGLNPPGFDSNLHGAFIADRGFEMVHELALYCPCQAGDYHAAQIADSRRPAARPWCGRCRGTSGFLYRDPKPLLGLVTGIEHKPSYIEAGFLVPGDLVFSPDYTTSVTQASPRRVGHWDRLRATWPQEVGGGQVIVRGAAQVARNLACDLGLQSNEDRLYYEPAGGIWCEDDEGSTYEPGDYLLGPGKRIRWTGEKRPADGQRYVLKYTAVFDWIAFAPPMERLDKGGVSIGQRVYLRKQHVVHANAEIGK